VGAIAAAVRTEPLGAAIVALQHFLMDAVRLYPKASGGASLASSATLDYALALARAVPGSDAMTADERDLAIDEAIGNAVDDALDVLKTLAKRDPADAKAFAAAHGLGRGMLATLGVLVQRRGVATTERRFALVVLGDTLA
jgi:hypothetical protein